MSNKQDWKQIQCDLDEQLTAGERERERKKEREFNEATQRTVSL